MSTAAHDFEVLRLRELVRPAELINELDDGTSDAAQHLLSAVLTRRVDLIGELVLAVFDAYVDRLADRELETELERPVYADDAAMRVLLAASIEQAAAHRACMGVAEYVA